VVALALVPAAVQVAAVLVIQAAQQALGQVAHLHNLARVALVMVMQVDLERIQMVVAEAAEAQVQSVLMLRALMLVAVVMELLHSHLGVLQLHQVKL
jgi:hypothetical protein